MIFCSCKLILPGVGVLSELPLLNGQKTFGLYVRSEDPSFAPVMDT